jgi:hypothetical protein
VAFIGSSLNAGSIDLYLRCRFGGLPSVEAGGSSSGSMGKKMVLGGGKKTFLEVVGKTGQLEEHY